jgi:hypothetical protein
VNVSDALTQMLGTQASKVANATPGLRLAGTYSAPGGFSIEFRDGSATVECGRAHNAEAYSVVRTIAIRPFFLLLPFSICIPNGALRYFIWQPNGMDVT